MREALGQAEASMERDKPLKLSRLRDIGWSRWDPIGLLKRDEAWKDRPFADEYDSYLLKVAGQLRAGGSADEATAYLAWVETEHMGFGEANASIARLRARATVEEIIAYLAEP